uniref:TNFR-Cys domain-containing protein n=1 Tax=Paramormyrops kingsleyae TaxID=1676925 RepID=A0A3B3SZD4_9TELE
MMQLMNNCKSTYLILLCVNYNLCYACGQAEYKIGDECCPMCHPGTRVYRHCTAWTSTSCAPCTDSTFNDQPSGREQCSPCTVCDEDLGLKTVKECTHYSDTQCGVLEGHYCINPYMGGCRAANKHTACKPGQFIKQPGTEYTDTVCEDCSDNSYSDGSSMPCKPHTDCESRGLLTVKAGDQATDSECKEKSDIGLSVGIPAAAAIAAIAVIAVKCRRRIKPYTRYEYYIHKYTRVYKIVFIGNEQKKLIVILKTKVGSNLKY